MTRQNRQVLLECDGCDYRLRMSRTQAARGLPLCGVCRTEMLPRDIEVAAAVCTLEQLAARPEWAEHKRAETAKVKAQSTFKNGRRTRRCGSCGSLRAARKRSGENPACAKCGDTGEPSVSIVKPRESSVLTDIAGNEMPF